MTEGQLFQNFMAAAKRGLLHFCFLFLRLTFSNSADTITTDQSFKEDDLLVSKGNNFAFGFFSPGSSSNRYLGIWFHEIPERSIVWVANRNSPITGSSAVSSINQYGNLILYNDPDQRVLAWSTDVTEDAARTCVAQLLDTGNLVLLEPASRRIVW
ncbi:hypothetical protein RCOM_0906880 [Ricinus communis]|uniref:Bulb-type lectin domain-containing protein n=1 Tax=Ricinus communis TaxID=3988 RepID=B9RXX8_RICCO|nr:hypothetical protein RCOM_0906880 [Ricinus communis]